MPICELGGGPVCTFCFPGGQFALLPPISYASDQMHFKHEQPQVLLPDSHVTVSMIRQTQDVANVL